MQTADRAVVLIGEELSPATVEALGPDFEVRHCDGTDRAALLAAITDAEAVLVRSATRIDAEALAAAPRLRVVARAGVGLDNIDVRAATMAGVMVVNAPTSNIVSAAELAVALMLAAARHVSPAHAALRHGEWKRARYTGIELYEKTVGVVGLGRIGVLVAQRLAAFGMNVIAYDPYVQAGRAAQVGVRLVDLDTLLAESDFMSVHLPKTPERPRSTTPSGTAGSPPRGSTSSPPSRAPTVRCSSSRTSWRPPTSAPRPRRRRRRRACPWPAPSCSRWPASSCPTRSTCRAG
jgi:D-3-phosphoglycerate dehydrogenase